MSSTPPWIIAVTVAFCAVALAALLYWARARRRRRLLPGGPASLQLVCSACQHDLVIAPQQLQPLSPPEVALVVRSKPQCAKRKLAEHTCPHCESAHIFITDCTPPLYVGADIYTPRTGGNRCMECDRPLRRPAWGRGEYDNRLAEAPLAADHGLRCQFCKAVFCQECSERISRNLRKKREEITLYCPRCFRQPVVNVYHP